MRFDDLCEWLTVLPATGPLPQMLHLNDMDGYPPYMETTLYTILRSILYQITKQIARSAA